VKDNTEMQYFMVRVHFKQCTVLEIMLFKHWSWLHEARNEVNKMCCEVSVI